LSTTVSSVFGELFPLSPQDVINLEENYSSVQLMHKLHHYIPTVPNKLNEQFEALDPGRLLKLLRFKYPYFNIWDGRIIAGRHSTVLNMSFVNNELALHGENYQDPNTMYSFAILCIIQGFKQRGQIVLMQ
jgi:hypothetical protein